MGQAKTRSSLKSDELVELDMLLTPQQMKELYSPDSRKKRGAIAKGYWPHAVIPYSFTANTFSEKDKTVIYAAMK